MSTFGPYNGVVDYVQDGDTVYVRLEIDHDEGFDLHLLARIYARVRVLGINAPELTTPEGKAARDYARDLLPVGTPVRVTSVSWDKYGGRVDGYIFRDPAQDFGAAMIAAGHAVPYGGGAR